MAGSPTKWTTGTGKIVTFLRSLGPGLVTGASDDDPSGIGTYAQTGALFGYLQLWIALFTLPLMIAIQESCARIGLQAGAGLSEVIRHHYPRAILYGCIFLLVIANTINIGADLGAMAAVAQLLIGWPFYIWLLLIVVISVLLQVLLQYRVYASLLRYLTLSLFAYVLVAFTVRLEWSQILRNTFIPTLQFSREYWLNLVAILGTTISPYLFFWQADQEVEELEAEEVDRVVVRPVSSAARLRWMRSDVAIGMLLSNLVAWFIIITTASTLHLHGVQHIDNAVEAAQALRPLAGPLAYLIFAAGILGTGFLVVPVLAGSAAYALAEAFSWQKGLNLTLRQAPGFYGVIILATLTGMAMNLIGISPFKALYYAAALNGIIAPPLLLMVMLVANNRKIMGRRVNGAVSNALGWLTTAVMTLATIALVWSYLS